jgi:hypothetical protein
MATKNVQYTEYFNVWDINLNLPKTGDAGNITMSTAKDGGSVSTTTNSIAETDSTNLPGVYELTLTAAEMNGNNIVAGGVSVTVGVVIAPSIISTEDIKPDTTQTISDVANVQTDTTQIISDVSSVQADTTQLLLDTIAIKADTNAIVLKLPGGTISDMSLDDVVDGAKLRTIFGIEKARAINKYNWNETTGQLDFFQNDNVTAFASVQISDVGRTKLSFVDL